MITIDTMEFSNVLSYGSGNCIKFDKPVTQLIGSNGVGKSSLAVILEEALYNKNSKGIKKGDLKNRYNDADSYEIKVTFRVGLDLYILHKRVKSSPKVTLTKNNTDISGHTTTQTYKELENILGMDFSTFTKLVNQSMISSLDFLSATDSNRKKFLVSLLGLERYLDIEKIVKVAASDSKAKITQKRGSIDTVSSWISSNRGEPVKLELMEVPEDDPELTESLIKKSSQLHNVTLLNSNIQKNNSLRATLNKLQSCPINFVEDNSKYLREIQDKLSEAKTIQTQNSTEKALADKEVLKIRNIKETCHVCGSPLDIGDKEEMLQSAEKVLQESVKALANITGIVAELEKNYHEQVNIKKSRDEYLKWISDMEEVSQKVDLNLETGEFSDKELKTDIAKLKTDIAKLKTDIAKATEHNQEVIRNNLEIDSRIEQKKIYEEELNNLNNLLEKESQVYNKLAILSEALGTKGLVSYKIESVTKIFEGLINEYLQVLADGDFVLSFIIEDTKLALRIYSRGVVVDIKSLSSGELNKVNTATLLAVRRVMTSLSKIDINIMFLDEVVSVLDQESKDTLIEVLLRESKLNSLVVSHGYTHPLANTINVIKENNISRLE